MVGGSGSPCVRPGCSRGMGPGFGALRLPRSARTQDDGRGAGRCMQPTPSFQPAPSFSQPRHSANPVILGPRESAAGVAGPRIHGSSCCGGRLRAPSCVRPGVSRGMGPGFGASRLLSSDGNLRAILAGPRVVSRGSDRFARKCRRGGPRSRAVRSARTWPPRPVGEGRALGRLPRACPPHGGMPETAPRPHALASVVHTSLAGIPSSSPARPQRRKARRPPLSPSQTRRERRSRHARRHGWCLIRPQGSPTFPVSHRLT